MKQSPLTHSVLRQAHGLALAATVGLIFQSLAVRAQEGVQGEAVATAPAPQVSDAQLDQAVDTYLAVNAIQQDLQRELAGVTDQEEIQQRTQAAHNEMMQAVADAGLDYETYSAIIEAVNHDETLRQAFFQRLDARQGPPDAQREAHAGVAADYTDQELAQAVEVYQAVTAINQQLREDLDEISDPDAIQQRVAEAEQAMLQSAADAGIDSDRYGEIMQAVQHDEAVAQRFIQIMQQ